MKEYDNVKLINDRAEYKESGVAKDMTGIILGPKRGEYWLVYFDGEIYQDTDGVYKTTEIDIGVKEEDLVVI